MEMVVSFKTHWEHESTYFGYAKTCVSFKANRINIKMNVCLFND